MAGFKVLFVFFLNTLLSLFSMGSPAIREFKLARTHSNKDSQYMPSVFILIIVN